MYRSGNSFNYDFLNTYQGSHHCKLNKIETLARELRNRMISERGSTRGFEVQAANLKQSLNQDYSNLKRDMNEEIDDFQMKLNLKIKQQKVENVRLNKEMNEVNNDLVKGKNLLIELQDRVKALQLRIDGFQN